MPKKHTTEGFVTTPDGRLWHRIVELGGGIPLLTLHGGPGAGHDYLEPLEDMASERPVIFYDQLGCGRSDKPSDRSLWRIERFAREVDTVRRALGLEKIHLLGQSWGGWLAIEYMLTQPRGVVSLVLSNTSASTAEFVKGTKRLIARLPRKVKATMDRYEAVGEFRAPEYQQAMLEFYKRHVCRLDPWPACLMRTVHNLEENQVYETMNGPNEYTVVGNLRDLDRTKQLGDIRLPTLVVCGRHDEIVPECSLTLFRGIPGSRLHIFGNSSHTPHLEETEEYLHLLRGFLRDQDPV